MDRTVTPERADNNDDGADHASATSQKQSWPALPDDLTAAATLFGRLLGGDVR